MSPRGSRILSTTRGRDIVNSPLRKATRGCRAQKKPLQGSRVKLDVQKERRCGYKRERNGRRPRPKNQAMAGLWKSRAIVEKKKAAGDEQGNDKVSLGQKGEKESK